MGIREAKRFSVIVVCVLFMLSSVGWMNRHFNAFSLKVLTKNGDLRHREKTLQMLDNRDSTKNFLPRDSVYWTILMTVNTGFLDFFFNWLLQFKKLGVKCPLIVMAHDENAFNVLQNNPTVYEHLSVVRSDNKPIKEAADFRSRDFIALNAERPQFILNHLKEGRNTLYVDADTVWVSSPFPHFTGEFDLWVQQDANMLCAGFMAIQSNNKTLRFIEHWRDEVIRVNATLNEQIVLNKIIRAYKSKKINLKRLDNKKFPDGNKYFDRYNETERKAAVVVHNNYIVGHDKKLTRFRKHGLWLLDSQHYPNITV